MGAPWKRELLFFLALICLTAGAALLSVSPLHPLSARGAWRLLLIPLALAPLIALLRARAPFGRGRGAASWILRFAGGDEPRGAAQLLTSFLKRRSLSGGPFHMIYVFRGGEALVQLCAPAGSGGVVEEFLSSLRPEVAFRRGALVKCPQNGAEATPQGPAGVGPSNRDEIPLGCTYDGRRVAIMIGDLFRHVGVFGSTGSGKTTTCSLLASALAERGIRVVVLDWHGEYAGILPRGATKVLRPISDGASINPLALSDDGGDVVDLLADVFDLTQPQASVLSAALREGRGASTLPELLEVMFAEAGRSPVEREIRMAIARRMEPLSSEEGRSVFGNGEAPGLPGAGEILVVDLSEIGSHRLRKLYALMLLRLIFAEASARGPLGAAVIVDEAHNVLPRAEVNFIARMLAEVRKMGVGLIVSTQSPSSVNPEFLKNLNTKIVHRIVNGADVRVILSGVGRARGLAEALPALGVGEALVSAPGLARPLFVRIGGECTV